MRVGTPPRVLDTQALAWLNRPAGARGPTELPAPARVGLSGAVGSGRGTEEEVERGVGVPSGHATHGLSPGLLYLRTPE